METAAPSAAHVRAGPYGSGISAETGRTRYRSTVRFIGPRVIRIGVSVQEQQADLWALMRRYRNRPMSLADACLVRLSEIHAAAEVLTLDGDFRIYRRHGNRVIPLRIPN